MIVDYRPGPLFSDSSRNVVMATNFRVKIGKIGLFTFIRSPGIPKQLQYRHSDFKMFICDDLAVSSYIV